MVFISILEASRIKKNSKLLKKNKKFIELSNIAQSYAPFARLAYCPKNVINSLKCDFCGLFANEFTTFSINSALFNNNRLFQMVIVYSDSKREVVIAFSGPKTSLSEIFNLGKVLIPELGNLSVEKEFWEIYSNNFRNILAKKMMTLSESGRADYNYIFLGHSAGGSLATLAALDMVNSNVLIKTLTSPKVFTYGGLQIGDEKFEQTVNKNIHIIKIVKNDDYITKSVQSCKDINGKIICDEEVVKSSKTQKLKKKGAKKQKKNESSFVELNDPIVKNSQFVNGRLIRHDPVYPVDNGNVVEQPSSLLSPEIVPPNTFGKTGPIYPNNDNMPIKNYLLGNKILLEDNSVVCPIIDGKQVCQTNLEEQSNPMFIHRNYYNMDMHTC